MGYFYTKLYSRRLVGEEAKENLKLNIVNDKSTIQKLTYNITTMTGYYSAFKCFSYLGSSYLELSDIYMDIFGEEYVSLKYVYSFICQL